LEADLNRLKKIQHENQKAVQVLSYHDQANNSRGIEREFALRNKESDFVDQMVMKGTLKSGNGN
jgi:hypothetical protein